MASASHSALIPQYHLTFEPEFLFYVSDNTQIIDEGDNKRPQPRILRFVYNSSMCVHVIKRACLLKKEKARKIGERKILAGKNEIKSADS